MQNKIYDVIVIGGGPAGYTAALYATRAGLSTLVVEKFSPGGQMTQTSEIHNYPGFDDGVDGFTLGEKMKNGAVRFGAEALRAEVLSVSLSDSPRRITTDSGELLGRTVIIATGAEHKHLGVPGEESFLGRGVGYCAACDGMLYRGKTVAVVGGGNSATADAALLSKICKKVYLIHRRNSFRGERINTEYLRQAPNVEFILQSELVTIEGEGKISQIQIKNNVSGEISPLPVDGLFISVGRKPTSELFASQIELDEYGYIIADESTKTSIDGVFAAGDVRTKPFRQIVTATADGATAAHFAEEYLAKKG